MTALRDLKGSECLNIILRPSLTEHLAQETDGSKSGNQVNNRVVHLSKYLVEIVTNPTRSAGPRKATGALMAGGSEVSSIRKPTEASWCHAKPGNLHSSG